MKETGIRRTEDGGIFCERCGNDLQKEGSARFMAHLDGTTFYANQFCCNRCNAVISQTYERSAEDAALWACDESEESDD